MQNVKYLFLKAVVVAIFFTGCSEDEAIVPDTVSELTVDIQGLEDLGDDYAYEGWLIVDGSPISAGIFRVDAEGNLSQSTFNIDQDDLDRASAYVLTIEPSPDNDPNPSSVHILAGDFSGNSASLRVDHGSALGTDFTASTGSYILATPTDGGSETNELSGVWWLDPSAGPEAGLKLPTLPNGWEYEGWAVVDGRAVSTGKFTSVSGPDDFSGFSGTEADAPPFPGEDLLINAPSGLTFPTDLSGGLVVISVEPSPDNSEAPFLLKPLVGMVPSSAAHHTLYGMDNNASSTNPSGTITK